MTYIKIFRLFNVTLNIEKSKTISTNCILREILCINFNISYLSFQTLYGLNLYSKPLLKAAVLSETVFRLT